MTVDRERVERLLDRLVSDVRSLREVAARDGLATDDIALAAAKYGVVVVVEGASRIAHHLVVSEGWPVAESNGDAFRTVASAGVIPKELGERLALAVGFRNLLVHRYDDIDDDRAVANLSSVGDFEDFAAHVARWLEGR
jgi:uncharacterized protein YutE (UPF0331/DUF86 family)